MRLKGPDYLSVDTSEGHCIRTGTRKGKVLLFAGEEYTHKYQKADQLFILSQQKFAPDCFMPLNTTLISINGH